MNNQTAEDLEQRLKLALAGETFGSSPTSAPADRRPDEAGSSPPANGESDGTGAPEESAGKRRKHPLFHLRKILVPVDFSEPSENALAYASRFAEEFGARLVLMHVISPITYSTPGLMPPQILNLESDLHRNATEKLNQWKAAAMGSKTGRIPPPETYVCTGAADVEINRAARAMEANLIIIATRGFTGLKHYFLGSTTAHLVRSAPCPVLVVREHEREFI